MYLERPRVKMEQKHSSLTSDLFIPVDGRGQLVARVKNALETR